MIPRHERLALFAATLVLGASGVASAHASQLAPEAEMQAQSSEGPTWHAGDGTVYDTAPVPRSGRIYENEISPGATYYGTPGVDYDRAPAATYDASPRVRYYDVPPATYYRAPDGTIYYSVPSMVTYDRLPARDYLLPDDLTNGLTPAESSRITGHADSSGQPALSGSDTQPGNMGPNNSKGQ